MKLFYIGVLVLLVCFLVWRDANSSEKTVSAKRVNLAEAVYCCCSNEGAPPLPRVARMKVTAYCPCEECCGKWAKYGKTTLGDDSHLCDGVAADFRLLPKWTRIEIPGVGVREVDDGGGSMSEDADHGIYHIDLRFPTHQQAEEWGVQWLDVSILNGALYNEALSATR